jgi:hypothetical protein
MKRATLSRMKFSLSFFVLLMALQQAVVFGQKCKTTAIKRTDINGSTWLLNNEYNSNQVLVKVTINQTSYPITPYSNITNTSCMTDIRSLEFDTITFYKYKRFVTRQDFFEHEGSNCAVGPFDDYNDHIYMNVQDGTGRTGTSIDSLHIGFYAYNDPSTSLRTYITNRKLEYLGLNLNKILYSNQKYMDSLPSKAAYENGTITYEYENTTNYNNMTQFNISDSRILFENNENHIKTITTIGHINYYGDTSLRKIVRAYSYVMDTLGCISSVYENITDKTTKNGITASLDSMIRYTYYYSENPLSIGNPYYENQNRMCAQLLVQRANDAISIEKLPSQSALEVFNISGALLSRFEGQEKVFLSSQNSPLILHLTSSGQSCSRIVPAPF